MRKQGVKLALEKNGFSEQQGKDCACGVTFPQRAFSKFAVINTLSLS